jgi:hypothetical protein
MFNRGGNISKVA